MFCEPRVLFMMAAFLLLRTSLFSMVMSLKPETYKKLERTGITAMMILEAPAGTYRLRTVVREGLTGKLYAATQPLVLQQQ